MLQYFLKIDEMHKIIDEILFGFDNGIVLTIFTGKTEVRNQQIFL